MDRNLHVTYAVSRYVANAIDGQRVYIEVDDAENIPTKVFAYLTKPLSAVSATYRGMFSHVCSAADLEDFPEDEPLSGSVPGWFRLNYLDLVVRSAAEAQNLIELVLADLRALKRTLVIMDTLGEPEEVWIDDPPELSSSSSESL